MGGIINAWLSNAESRHRQTVPFGLGTITNLLHCYFIAMLWINFWILVLDFPCIFTYLSFM